MVFGEVSYFIASASSNVEKDGRRYCAFGLLISSAQGNKTNLHFSHLSKKTPPLILLKETLSTYLCVLSSAAQERRFVPTEPERQQQTLQPSGSCCLTWFAEYQDRLYAGSPPKQVNAVAGLII